MTTTKNEAHIHTHCMINVEHGSEKVSKPMFQIFHNIPIPKAPSNMLRCRDALPATSSTARVGIKCCKKLCRRNNNNTHTHKVRKYLHVFVVALLKTKLLRVKEAEQHSAENQVNATLHFMQHTTCCRKHV